jgi:2-dehydro-3-deoxygalactonokinase
MRLAAEPAWIAVDWGTSNLRLWGLDRGGAVLFSAASDQGMGRLDRDGYPAALAALLAGRLAPDGPAIDVVVCGMAGARQGWMEAPYLATPADLDDLAAKAVRPDLGASRLRPRILPGLCQTDVGHEDVMRGEETQLLGLAALQPGFSGLVCMPGTHCKWARLDGRRVERFTSAMTGELFDVLKLHSVLRHSLNGTDDPVLREQGLDEGLAIGLAAPERLISRLFKVRAAALLSDRPAAWCAGFLSGLLIGSEVGGQRADLGHDELPLIGGTALSRIYARALAMVGVRSRHVDAADAVLAGLAAARQAGA